MEWYKFKTVLDPYMGSGTTALAAKELGKHYLGFEIDDAHYKTCVDLLEGPQLF
jgi:site-specific DNA-methyltransferase (adenine-specific)